MLGSIPKTRNKTKPNQSKKLLGCELPNPPNGQVGGQVPACAGWTLSSLVLLLVSECSDYRLVTPCLGQSSFFFFHSFFFNTVVQKI